MKINGITEPGRNAFSGKLCCVIFSPNHLSLVRDGPAERRDFLDGAISQLRPQYIKVLSDYNRALAQRSTLLRRPSGPRPAGSAAGIRLPCGTAGKSDPGHPAELSDPPGRICRRVPSGDLRREGGAFGALYHRRHRQRYPRPRRQPGRAGTGSALAAGQGREEDLRLGSTG